MPKTVYTFQEARAVLNASVSVMNHSTSFKKYVAIFGIEGGFDTAIEKMVESQLKNTRYGKISEGLKCLAIFLRSERDDAPNWNRPVDQVRLLGRYVATTHFGTLDEDIWQSILGVCDSVPLDLSRADWLLALEEERDEFLQLARDDMSPFSVDDGCVIDRGNDTITLELDSDQFIKVVGVFEKHGQAIGGLLDAGHHLGQAFKAVKGLIKPLADAIRDDIKAVLKK